MGDTFFILSMSRATPRIFSDRGIRLYTAYCTYSTRWAIAQHPDLIPFLEPIPFTPNNPSSPPRIDKRNREALLKYNSYLAADLYNLDIQFAERAIIPTPVMRYHFLCHVIDRSRHSFPIIIEIGTGASAIIALLAAKHFNAQVFATEIDPDYIQLAQNNIDRNGMKEKITLLHSHGEIFHGLIPPGVSVDYIVSNPPYYEKIRSPKVLWGGKDQELIGEGDFGEHFILSFIQEGWEYLRPHGVLAFIIPKTRTETLIAVETYLQQHRFLYDIIGLLAGNRTRYVFRIHKSEFNNSYASEFQSETDP